MAYNALIDAQARVGAMEEVETLVTSMQPNGCTPDVITFSTIVKGYCAKGELNKALEVCQCIERNGMVADAIIYNTILDGCIRHNARADVQPEHEEIHQFPEGLRERVCEKACREKACESWHMREGLSGDLDERADVDYEHVEENPLSVCMPKGSIEHACAD